MKTVKQIFLDSADHIERVGFHKGGFFKYPTVDYTGGTWELRKTLPCCVRGAFQAVLISDAGVDHFDTRKNARLEFTRFLGLDPAATREAVSVWNDAPERTQEEVVSALRQAAAAQPDDPIEAE